MVVITEEIHARVISGTGQGQPGSGASAVNNLLVPALSKMEGYRGCDLLVAEDNRFHLITWWTNCPGGTAAAVNQMYEDLVGLFSGVVTLDIADHVRYVRRAYHRMDGSDDDELPPID